MSEIIRQVEAAIDQGAHHGEYAERVVSLQFLRRVLAALRVPTIAVTDEMVDAALTEYVGEPPFEDYFGEEGVGPHRLNMRAALEAALATPSPAHEPPFITCDDCGAKLTDMRCIETTEDRCWHKNCPTPSPTIAAPSPSQSNAIDLPPCPVCGETLVTRYSGPLPGCPQGISTAVCPTDPSHASQPPQPSPSNEVTAAMVDAAMRELDFGDGPPLDVAANRNAIRAAIEAALKARKPADDGAGQ